jgi:GcrA cell cycle regulator
MNSENCAPEARASHWTEARQEQLVSLWSQGLSATKIAQALGEGFTRNAVVGKLFRLGLKRTDEQRQDAQAEGARHSRAVQRWREGVAAVQPRPRVQDIPLPPPTPCDVVPQLMQVVELRPSTCRWPYGEAGEMRFCGHRTRAEGPYCPAHHRIAYFGRLPPLTLEALRLSDRASPRRIG